MWSSFFLILQCLYFLLLSVVLGATLVSILDKIKELWRRRSQKNFSWTHIRIILQYLLQMDTLFFLISMLTQLFSSVLYRKIVNGMSGRLPFCRTAIWLKMSIDGLVGMILFHLCAMHVLDLFKLSNFSSMRFWRLS